MEKLIVLFLLGFFGACLLCEFARNMFEKFNEKEIFEMKKGRTF